VPARPGGWAPVISVRGLTRRYGDVVAVADLSFDVEPGKVTGKQGWFALYNLAAGCLGIAGAVVGVVLAANRGRERVQRWLLLAAAVASVLLLLRGALGVTLLGAGLLSGSHDEQTPWLLLAIEPWFVLGGLAFGGLALSQRRQAGAHRLARAAS
jgi:hypothetical protein